MSDERRTSVVAESLEYGEEDHKFCCPWSSCFPHTFSDKPSRLPCTQQGFPNWRTLNDHIWKYHSNVLCCEQCDHRFINGPREDKRRPQLEKLKEDHRLECHPTSRPASVTKKRKRKVHERPTQPKDQEKTMTEEDDLSFQRWQKEWSKQGTQRRPNCKERYDALCLCLFGAKVVPPDTPYYQYWVPQHTRNTEIANRSLCNLAYARERYSTSDLARLPARQASVVLSQTEPVSSNQQHLRQDAYTLGDTSIDLGRDPPNYGPGQPAEDSGYGSKDNYTVNFDDRARSPRVDETERYQGLPMSPEYQLDPLQATYGHEQPEYGFDARELPYEQPPQETLFFGMNCVSSETQQNTGDTEWSDYLSMVDYGPESIHEPMNHNDS
ncbi:hypothetical protein F4780DRAFT_249755 [Xylariomycetidae sp. FL0641]|nr:hypothetical protein F4780DRAFT_249755 [Xylariomycetidae sp. FL0641]